MKFFFNAKLAFTYLKQALIIILILYHFDLKYYIWILIDNFSYNISEILYQMSFNNLDCLYLLTFFSKKIIV